MDMGNCRQAYGQALREIGEADGRIVVLEADLGKSTMSFLFGQAYADRYFQVGIAEQNMASMAAGFALTGKTAFMNSFAVFASGRPYDQIRSSICIPNLNVKICGSSAGLSDFGDGKTHQSVDDIAIMRVLPNMTVLSPVDSVETAQMVKAMCEKKGPCYIRINRNDLPIFTNAGDDYHIGKMRLIRGGRSSGSGAHIGGSGEGGGGDEGKGEGGGGNNRNALMGDADVAVFATGIMVSRAVAAADMLAKEGVSVRVVNVSTIKPLDADALKMYCAGVKGVVTSEEHSVIGGLGSAVCETLRASRLPIEIHGIEDSFGISAENYDALLERFHLTSADVASKVRSVLRY